MALDDQLPPPVAEAAAFVRDRNVESIRGGLRDLALPSAAYAVCLWPADAEGQLDAPYISVGLDRDRGKVLASMSPYRAFQTVWNANTYAIDLMSPVPDLRAEPDFLEAELKVVAFLAGRDVLDPARWILDRVARELTLTPPIGPVTDDFVAFVLDEEFDEDLVSSLKAAAPPTVASALREKRLLPDDPTELEGFDALFRA